MQRTEKVALMCVQNNDQRLMPIQQVAIKWTGQLPLLKQMANFASTSLHI